MEQHLNIDDHIYYDFDINDDTSDEYVPKQKTKRPSVCAPPPMQIAAKNSVFNSYADIVTYYDNQVKLIKEKKEKEQQQQEQKELYEQIQKKIHPFPRVFVMTPADIKKKQQKMADERRARRLALYKKRKNRKNKPLPFPHRRNGGGKGSFNLCIDKEIIKERRAAHKKEVKKKKLSEERERTEKFSFNEIEDKKKEDIDKLSSIYSDLNVNTETEEEEVGEELDNIRKRIAIKLNQRERTADTRVDDSHKFTYDERKLSRAIKFSSHKVLKKQFKRWKAIYTVKKEKEKWCTVTSKKRKNTFATTTPAKKLKIHNPDHARREQPKINKQRRYTRTKVCTSVIENKPCSRENCSFAHSINDLVARKCSFGYKCFHVRKSHRNGKIVNWGRKICTYIHPGETKREFYHRVLSRPNYARPKSRKPSARKHCTTLLEYNNKTDAMHKLNRALKTGITQVKMIKKNN